MNAKDYINRLAPADRDLLAGHFNFLADHAHELTLMGGQRLNDNLDFAAFHRELAAACTYPESVGVEEEVA